MSRRPLHVLRVYHAGRDPGHRERERALVAAGVEVTLVVPRQWPGPGDDTVLAAEPFRVVELDVARAGHVNRHVHRDDDAVGRLVAEVQPDVIDLHEEPFSLVTRQWLRHIRDTPVVIYTAQNIDKRYPPPFAQYEGAALRRAHAVYPCSRQAASVVRGKGFTGLVEVLPLGVDDATFFSGDQAPDDATFGLLLVGRLVPEKGVRDAVRVLAVANRLRSTRLRIVGQGPELEPALALAARLRVADRVDVVPWCTSRELGALYRQAHVVLIPSRRTATWVEQFGRVIVEAHASGAVVAGYATGAIAEVTGDCGLLVPEGQTDELADVVCELAMQPGLVGRLRAAGIELARNRSWTAVAQRQAALYRDVLNGPPSATGEVAATGMLAVTGAPAAHGAGRDGGASRVLAALEFGEPATTAAGRRPLAAPLVSRSRLAAAAVGSLIEAPRQLRNAWHRSQSRDSW